MDQQKITRIKEEVIKSGLAKIEKNLYSKMKLKVTSVQNMPKKTSQIRNIQNLHRKKTSSVKNNFFNRHTHA